MAEDAKKTKTGTPLWVKLLLGASLALNLLIIGAVAGTAFRVARSGGDAGPPRGIAFVAALEKNDRREILSELRSAGRETRQAGNADMRQVLDLLRADPFDATAFAAVLQNQTSRTQDIQTHVRAELINKVSAMNSAQRQVYADRLEAHVKRGGKRKDKRRGDH